jgi:short-subunit dehydrogenase
LKALITGASSGIGLDMAKLLSKEGHELMLVSRDAQKLSQLAASLPSKCVWRAADLSIESQCHYIYEEAKAFGVDTVINNAGFGIHGDFTQTPLDDELNLIRLNITAVHILTKLFVRDFAAAGHGSVLNVASAAAFLPGPLMSAYYSSKAYVLRLTLSVREELRRSGVNVYIGVLCPGPVNTGFSKRAGVDFAVKALNSSDVAKYAIRMMRRGKAIIIPGLLMRLAIIGQRLLPTSLLSRISYNIQKRKA